MAEFFAKRARGAGTGIGPSVNHDPWAALRTLRIGCVKYLNSRPLICAYDGDVVFEHPSVLATMLAADKLDAALVPTFEVLRNPHYAIVDDVAIACCGPVYSVILAYHGELRDVQSVALDPASMSSANLVRVMLGEFHGTHPTFGSTGDSRLIIGNQAIDFRLNEEKAGGWQVLDLGAEWNARTGLPFVFAVWAMRAGVPIAAAEAFRELKRIGTAQIPALVKNESFATAELRETYLKQHVQFGIGDAGRKAIAKYREMLLRAGLISDGTTPLEFV